MEFYSRYGGPNDPLPDPKTMCGECEGMGVYPLCNDEWKRANQDGNFAISGHHLTTVEQALWDAAEAKSPTDDGWHFIRCEKCGGTGKR